MKKSLLMATAMALSMSAGAYAANPFTDVPAGHWAYDAVAKLADAGVVDGYGATFGGDKLMTRYEMAQIVAKAMAKGANCDKLSAEFAEELDSLGVRVAKLEKKVDNVKITGNIRYSYRNTSGKYGNPVTHTKKDTEHGKGYNRLRTRFLLNGQINDNWSYTGLLEKNTYLDTANKDDKITLLRSWLNGRIGGIKLEAGRCYFLQMSMIDGEGDGIKANYRTGDWNFIGWALKNQAVLHHGSKLYPEDPLLDSDRFYMVKVEKKFGQLDSYVAYWDVDCALGTKIWDVCLSYPFTKNVRLTGEYFNGDGDLTTGKSGDKNGYEVKLQYKGVKASDPGSWSCHAVYSDRPFATMMSQSTFAGYAVEPMTKNDGWVSGDGDGFKGWEVGANYVFAKNITGGIKYFDYETRKNADGHARTIWSEVVFIF